MATVKWRVCAITYNVAMKQGSEEGTDALLSAVTDADPDILTVGLQEVAHAETIGGTIWTWLRLITDWVTMRTGLVLLAKTYQATNQVIVFMKRSIVSRVKQVEFRYSRNSWGGATGHKGSIGVKIALKNNNSLVFIVSHFVHDVLAYDKRISQYKSNRYSAFEEDRGVRCAFWLGDLNFRVEMEPEPASQMISAGKSTELLEKHEQLNRAMANEEAFEGFSEAVIRFNPTYRMFVGTTEYDLHRTPSWTDRILHKGSVTPEAYNSIDTCLSSDHLPVMAVYSIQLDTVFSVTWDVIFEQLPTWFTPVPLVGRFQLQNDFWNKKGSYKDWIGLFPSSIVDCTSAVKWVWVATCFEQTYDEEKYLVCEFLNVPSGDYRLGYFSSNLNCLVGLSKSFKVQDPPCDTD